MVHEHEHEHETDRDFASITLTAADIAHEMRCEQAYRSARAFKKLREENAFLRAALMRHAPECLAKFDVGEPEPPAPEPEPLDAVEL